MAHVGGVALWTMESYGLQRATPDRFRGRVLALDYALASGLMAASMLATGRVVELVDARVVMAVQATVPGACACAWMLATRRFWQPS